MSEDRYKKAIYGDNTVEFWDKYEILPNEYKEHVYLVNDFETPSVTQVLQKQGIAPEYPENNNAVIKNRNRGTFIHHDCEMAIKDPNYQPLTTEGRWVKNNLSQMFKDFQTEVLICTGKYAGQLDLMCKTLDDSANVILDYKSGKYDTEVVSWQEKMYKEGQVYCNLIDPKLPTIYYVVELREKYEDCKLVQIAETPHKEYEKLYACIGTEKTYEKPTSIISIDNYYPSYTEADLERICTELGQLPTTVQYAFAKKIKNWVDAKDKEVKKTMLDEGIARAKTFDGCTWEIGERAQTKFDESAFKEKHPKLYEKFKKTTTSKVLYWKGAAFFDKRVSAPKDYVVEEKATVKEIGND